MTTIAEAFTTLAAVQQRIEQESGTTGADITRMLADIETARQGAHAALDNFRTAFDTVMSNLTADLEALRGGRMAASRCECHRSTMDLKRRIRRCMSRMSSSPAKRLKSRSTCAAPWTR